MWKPENHRDELRWDSSRGVLAFRGTDLNFSQPSGQADECADAFLNLDS